MSRIWCSISAHGFGHGAQVIPILNELGRQHPELTVLLRTNLPSHFFENQLSIPWEYHPSIQDIGCVQDGPLKINTQETLKAYHPFHKNWQKTVQTESFLIQSFQPKLVISNISYLAIEAGSRAGIPTVAIGSLSWDRVLEYLLPSKSEEAKNLIAHIQSAYQRAGFMIRFAPRIPLPAFRHFVDVGPVASPRIHHSGSNRKLLNMDNSEKLVVVAFGGIPLPTLPYDHLEGLSGYQFIIGENQQREGYTRVRTIKSLSIPFREILSEADVILTKPGYATIVEGVRNGTPIVYVRRYNFLDEQALVDYAHRYGRAYELSIDQFNKGEWLEALEKVQTIPAPLEPPPELGTPAAAKALLEFLH